MKRVLLLLTVPLLCVVAGCSRSSDDPGSPEPAATTPVAAPVWVAPSATGTGGTAAATGGVRPAPSPRKGTGGKANPRPTKTTTVTMDEPVSQATRCHTRDLRISLGTARTVGGSVYQPVILTNRSGHKCSVAGYPAVAWVDATGKAVNSPFGDVPRETPSEVVDLRPGSSAHATLIIPKPGTADEAQCLTVKVTGYRISP